MLKNTQLLFPIVMLLFGCGDNISTSGGGQHSDDDDSSVSDDDDSLPGDEVQGALDNITGWAANGCSQVTVWAVSGHSTVDLSLEANLDLNDLDYPHDEQYEYPFVGAVLTVRSGEDLGTDVCTATPGTPTVNDYYSVQSGSLTLYLDKAPQEPISQTRARLEFTNVELQRVGGSETVTIPNMTLPEVVVGWNP
jgi:hypothetical protein